MEDGDDEVDDKVDDNESSGGAEEAARNGLPCHGPAQKGKPRGDRPSTRVAGQVANCL